MSAVAAVRSALPSHVYRQEDITEQLMDVVLGRPTERTEKRAERVALLRRLHQAAGVRTRHTVLPLEAYADVGGHPRSLEYLDAFTVAHVTKNHASTSDPDIYGIYGPYTPL